MFIFFRLNKVIFPRTIIKIDWHVLPFSMLKKLQVSSVGHKDGFQVAWNFLESF